MDVGKFSLVNNLMSNRWLGYSLKDGLTELNEY